MTHPLPECGCERGGTCTKTTMCYVQSAMEDLQELVMELEAKLETAHQKIEWLGDAPE